MQVVSSSLLAEQQASLPESQEIQTNGDAAAEDSPLDADQSDSTDSEMENDGPAANGEVVCLCVCVYTVYVCGGGCAHASVTNSLSCEVAELRESVAGVLQCEFCGSRGYAHTFLRSKRFCSMTCVRR